MTIIVFFRNYPLRTCLLGSFDAPLIPNQIRLSDLNQHCFCHLVPGDEGWHLTSKEISVVIARAYLQNPYMSWWSPENCFKLSAGRMFKPLGTYTLLHWLWRLWLTLTRGSFKHHQSLPKEKNSNSAHQSQWKWGCWLSSSEHCCNMIWKKYSLLPEGWPSYNGLAMPYQEVLKNLTQIMKSKLITGELIRPNPDSLVEMPEPMDAMLACLLDQRWYCHKVNEW